MFYRKCFLFKARSGPSRVTAGPGKTFWRGLQTFSRGCYGEKNFEFLQNDTLWRTLYFWPMAGPQTSWGPG